MKSILMIIALKILLRQVYSPVLLLSPVSIIPPTVRTHLHLHAVLNRRTNGQSLGAFQKAMLLRKSGRWIEKYF
jgi:hypothetical protein